MYTIKAKIRELKSKKVKQLRKNNFIPAVIYGHGLKSRAIEVEYLTFEKILRQAGESSLIDLIIDNQKPVKVLIYDIQLNPITDRIQHIDFYQVKEKEKVTAEVELKFIGESIAVKEKGGIFIHQLTRVKIECLPKDLLSEISVDISHLQELNEVIKIKDLNISPAIKVLHHQNEIVAMVVSPKKEKEPEELKVEEKPVEAVASAVKDEVKKEEKVEEK